MFVTLQSYIILISQLEILNCQEILRLTQKALKSFKNLYQQIRLTVKLTTQYSKKKNLQYFIGKLKLG